MYICHHFSALKFAVLKLDGHDPEMLLKQRAAEAVQKIQTIAGEQWRRLIEIFEAGYRSGDEDMGGDEYARRALVRFLAEREHENSEASQEFRIIVSRFCQEIERDEELLADALFLGRAKHDFEMREVFGEESTDDYGADDLANAIVERCEYSIEYEREYEYARKESESSNL